MLLKHSFEEPMLRKNTQVMNATCLVDRVDAPLLLFCPLRDCSQKKVRNYKVNEGIQTVQGHGPWAILGT